MQQRTVITSVEDIRNVAGDINVFSCRRQIFKVQIRQYNHVENHELEKSVVRFYSFGQHNFWNALPGYTLLIYIMMILFKIIPYAEWGIVPTILLYVPFGFGLVFIFRVLIAWYAKRSLLKLADEMESGGSYEYAFKPQRQ